MEGDVREHTSESDFCLLISEDKLPQGVQIN